MILHGADIYVWSKTTPDLPKEFGPFKLVFISNRGTKVYPPPAPNIELGDWPQSRYESESEVKDSQIDELCAMITAGGFIWNKCEKLYWDGEGNRLYSQPY